MGREVRKVAADWDHPRNERGLFKPLYDESFVEAAADWKRRFVIWESGNDPDRARYPDYEFWEWEGMPPNRECHRPNWPEESRTHFQYYETVSEGTPLSPPMPTLEDLALWLVNNGEYGRDRYPDLYPRRTYEQWMKVLGIGWAPSMVFTPEHGIEDGATHMARTAK